MEVPNRTHNCDVNEKIIEGIQKDVSKIEENLSKFEGDVRNEVSEVKKDVKHIQKQNDVQNELLAKFDTMIDFIMNDRKEQREEKKEQKEINKQTIETLQSMNSNLILLNADMENVKEDVKILKNAEEKSKINVIVLLRDNISKVVSGAIGGAIILGLSWWLQNR